MLTFRKTYFILTVLLFATEVLIALYVQDRFIRPYFGDYLVVGLVYCFVRSFLRVNVLPAAIGTLLFAYFVETMQYIGLVNLLGLQKNVVARTVIGTGFEWWDMVAYTLGTLTLLLIETVIARLTRRRHEGSKARRRTSVPAIPE